MKHLPWVMIPFFLGWNEKAAVESKVSKLLTATH